MKIRPHSALVVLAGDSILARETDIAEAYRMHNNQGGLVLSAAPARGDTNGTGRPVLRGMTVQLVRDMEIIFLISSPISTSLRLLMSGLILTTVRRRAAGVLWITTLGLSSALAFEPFQVNVKENKPQPRTQDIDHLLPLEQTFTPPPEFDYLAQYWAKVSTKMYRYVVVFRNEEDGRFYVCEGDVPRHKVHPQQCQCKHKAEISSDTAQLVYDFWLNMLLQTRYSRQLLPHMPPTTLYIFSTCIAGGSWLHGYTLFPGVSPNLPPYWFAQAGEDLYMFATKSPREEKDLAGKVKANRDRFYEYMNAHPCETK